jgi:cytochrome b6-f complex iron-sulfur subunit
MRLSLWPAILGLALAMIVVTFVTSVPSSLSYASGILVLIAMVGWVIEARQIAGSPPEVEPEHEEEEEAPGPSYWPVVLAIGVVGIAAGLIYDYDWGALIIALPLAAAAAAAWGSQIQREMAEVEAQRAGGIPIRGSGGRTLLPVPAQTLAAQAAGGAAIAIERVETGTISRRSILRVTFWTGIVAFLGALAASTIDMLYPRGITGFGGVISAGTVEEFPPGSKTDVSEGKFWLVHLTEEQAKSSDPVNGKAGFLALWWKCPHLGCTVPWRPTFTFNDHQGWFRCPCHGSTYDDAGQRVFGPAPRSMDRMEITISGGRISVNTGAVTKGTPDNASFAVEA